jgi:predicted metal-dependent hydrolase
MPRIGWSRATRGRLRSIRFGSYQRQTGQIRIHPRLARPWIADLFLDAVIHHELCHHRQACDPVRGERTHSARFRAWDRAFPGHADAERWMRAHLPRMLADH